MSRNNLILVVSKRDGTSGRRRYHVAFCENADTQWDYEYAVFITTAYKFTYSRAKALVRAHNMQRRLDTEYGVREFET